MSRGARRRAERLAAANGGIHPHKTQHIQLANPVTQYFEAFIFANSLECEQVVKPGSCVGQSVVICGAGPSLADDAADYCNDADQLWGCNSALTWLVDNGYPVTHGITVDQTPSMLVEWESAPDVEYLVASTIHPHLTAHLKERGRTLRFFHNFVGLRKPPVEWCDCGHNHEGESCSLCDCTEYAPHVMAFEDWMYLALYPGTIRVGVGLNTAVRAVDLALAMGFDTVTVLGADCAMRLRSGKMSSDIDHGSAEHVRWLKEQTIMHADGGNALASGATPITLGGYLGKTCGVCDCEGYRARLLCGGCSCGGYTHRSGSWSDAKVRRWLMKRGCDLDGIHESNIRALMGHHDRVCSCGHDYAEHKVNICACGHVEARHAAGRWWESKPDMMISAVFLVKMQEYYGAERLRLIGDTLPNALAGKSDEFLDTLPAMLDGDGNQIRVNIIEPLLTDGMLAPALPIL